MTTKILIVNTGHKKVRISLIGRVGLVINPGEFREETIWDGQDCVIEEERDVRPAVQPNS